EIYTQKSLDDATCFSATTLESGVLINDGKAHFEFKPLPRLAQISPSHAAVLAHLDGDEHLDLVLAQNDFSPQRETGRMDGGLSLVLRGRGVDGFRVCWPHESNVSIGGDAQLALAADLNRDRRPDLIFGVNNEPWRAFISASTEELLAIRLVGVEGNPTAIGARVEVLLTSGKTLVQETYAGAGYLTQGNCELFFGLGQSTVKSIRVGWPNGALSEANEITNPMVIAQPEG
ncbi:MAG: ASPIC/UnbV domain-containing protein, partial [Planctomycetota bacterium]